MWLKLIVNVIIINVILALDVGDECKPTEDDPIGICTIYPKCEIAKSMVKTKRRHNFSTCGFNGLIEIVCCPKPTDRFGDPTEPPQSSLRIADRECQNIKKNSRPILTHNIINGVVAMRGEIQAMAALGYLRDLGYRFDCGGTLISSTYVVTAGHCIYTFDGVKPVIVRIGLAELGDSAWNDENDYNISESIKHPYYTAKERYHDIGLIRLEKPVPFNSNQGPACLYTNSEDPKTSLIVAGWGIINTTTEETSKVLKKANLTWVARDKCGQNYIGSRKLPQRISNEQLCAADPKGLSDTCKGDSGGPLLYRTATDDVLWLVGVTSFGLYCGTTIPGVYTRISSYLDWIESIVWPN